MMWHTPTMTDLQSIRAVLYTGTTMTTGDLRTTHWRLSDTMNNIKQSFVLVHDAAVQPLNGSPTDAVQTAQVFVNRDQIVLALPKEGTAGYERRPAQQALHVPRGAVQAVIQASPFRIEGVLHPPKDVDLLQYTHDPHHMFMPVSDASVTYAPSPLLSFRTQFLLLARANIETIMAVEQIGRKEETPPEMEPAKVHETPVSAVRAAEVLGQTPMLKKADPIALQREAEQLLQDGLLTRKECRENAAVFQQGDVGDTLYVVESGMLAVYSSSVDGSDGQLVDYLGPNDVFGEMAILGDGRRNASVVANRESSLIAVHQTGVQRLMNRFPSVSSALLGMVVQRQEGLRSLFG